MCSPCLYLIWIGGWLREEPLWRHCVGGAVVVFCYFPMKRLPWKSIIYNFVNYNYKKKVIILYPHVC